MHVLKRPLAALALAVASAFLCACAGKRGLQSDARARMHDGTSAQQGWAHYLLASDPAAAEPLFVQAAASSDAHERALALCGLAELRDDRLDLIGAAKAWQQVLESAPQDPLAELAALRLLDAEGDSGALDEIVVAAAKAGGLQPRAALLVRDAAARAALRAPAGEAAAWRALGALQSWRVGGPFAALRLFDLGKTLALDGPVPARAPAAFSRALEFPDGDVGLDLEPADGDVFYAVSEATAAQGGDYLAWVEGPGALELRFDGRAVLSRVPYPRESPRAQSVAVTLAKGTHSVLVRWSRAEGVRFRVSLVRADGAPSDLTSKAPAELTGARTEAPCALGVACAAAPAWKDDGGLRGFAGRALADDAGDCMSSWLLARVSLGDDRVTARAAAEQAVQVCFSSAPALALRAQASLHDPELPDRLGRSRALTDLTEATGRDLQLVRARLTMAALDREQERYDDAGKELDRAESALRALALPARGTSSATSQAGAPQMTAPLMTGTAFFAPPARLLLARARLLEAQGNTAAARAHVEQARKLEPTRCDARQLLFDYAQRDGGLVDRNRFAADLAPCNEGPGVQVRLARERGDLARAEELLKALAALRPAQPGRLESLAEVQQARQEWPAAIASLRAAAALAPRNAEPLRRLAGVLELSGDLPGAKAARLQALSLSPGDLSLRHALALDEHQPLLGWSDRDGLALARAQGPKAPPGAAAVRILDHGAVQIFADGGAVERVHTVARVLDKKGIARFGEAQIPGDAEILHLRTIKPDGRTLEPESIPEKETVSLPGLETGDAIEIDYLRGIAPHGPEMPGLNLGAFFFRDEETPMGESTSEVRSARPFEVDAHHLALEKPAPVQTGGEWRWSHTEREVAPQEPEPHEPSDNETMPWAQVGFGAGQAELMRSISDWLLLKARTSSGIEALVRAAKLTADESATTKSATKDSATKDSATKESATKESATDRQLALAIIGKVAQAVRGNGTELTAPASHVLSQGRGNRLLVVKAALAAAGIRAHLVLVRGFGGDQAQYRFPRSDLFPWAVLRIELAAGPEWYVSMYRLGPPFGLPPILRDQEGWVLPEPGEEPLLVRTPAKSAEDEGRELAFELTLSADGLASGTGRDRYQGFEAAGLKDALERYDAGQRKQAVEGTLGRGLRDLSLDALSTEGETEQGGAAALVYQLHAGIGQRDGARLLVPASLLPQRLSRRWVQTAERHLPLIVDSSDREKTRVSLTLPPGLHLAQALQPIERHTPFGDYSWSAREENGKLVLDEQLVLPLQRIPPEQYAAFASFARAVDEAQAQELVLAPR